MIEYYWQASILYQYKDHIERLWMSEMCDSLEELNDKIEAQSKYLKHKKGGYFEINKRIDCYKIDICNGTKYCELSICDGDIIIYD